jgi:hypothetical protein
MASKVCTLEDDEGVGLENLPTSGACYRDRKI